jgi:xanthine dehydrogenase accessory factor
MTHWQETAEITSHLLALAAIRRRAAVATVVRIVGSAYRRPGAKLLVLESGETIGSVSGGCLEADVREVARGVIETGRPVLRHYNAGDDDDVIGSLGLGCNGQVDIFIQPATSGPLAALIGSLNQALAGDSPLAIATVTTGADAGRMMIVRLANNRDIDPEVVDIALGALPDGRSALHAVADRQVFIDALLPPPHVVICGAGADAIPLVAYAADAGFRVTVLDHREGLLEPSLFPRAARRAVAHADDPEMVLPPPSRTLAVVKTHSFAHDRDWIRLLLGIGVPYVGVLGPKDRTERILREICDDDRDRVFGPVGLDIGADGPRQVAISIVAELLAFVSKRQPQHLAQRRQAIHAD